MILQYVCTAFASSDISYLKKISKEKYSNQPPTSRLLQLYIYHPLYYQRTRAKLSNCQLTKYLLT